MVRRAPGARVPPADRRGGRGARPGTGHGGHRGVQRRRGAPPAVDAPVPQTRRHLLARRPVRLRRTRSRPGPGARPHRPAAARTRRRRAAGPWRRGGRGGPVPRLPGARRSRAARAVQTRPRVVPHRRPEGCHRGRTPRAGHGPAARGGAPVARPDGGRRGPAGRRGPIARPRDRAAAGLDRRALRPCRPLRVAWPHARRDHASRGRGSTRRGASGRVGVARAGACTARASRRGSGDTEPGQRAVPRFGGRRQRERAHMAGSGGSERRCTRGDHRTRCARAGRRA